MSYSDINNLNRKQLQKALRNLREQGYTNIKLNKKNTELRTELRRVYKEMYRYTFCSHLADRDYHEVKSLWANLKGVAIAKNFTDKQAESYVYEILKMWDREGYEAAYDTFLKHLLG